MNLNRSKERTLSRNRAVNRPDETDGLVKTRVGQMSWDNDAQISHQGSILNILVPTCIEMRSHAIEG